ncbi:chemotaxis protein CheD [Methylocystis sp. MJC1]|jgi:chemotaxis protein CheD|uniref:chemotaxis protein CheD n=1 Tax=Methylocystis sp. MJC1 TaxID=2654282 RepID=UPI0013EACE6C|nr:chemotaxis protein CheD [Methylocystis sp. MJC1]KAF2990616.1 Chemoreceptor glutamine deamidase CheD [Methylocystis sp. MJC1]MBU6525723.1 chemotaxis protein CheD [Methylocystis sp. MJC1]UZX12194.1 chemotaxis protein CheD [Methylocystis sp. MJC1]
MRHAIQRPGKRIHVIQGEYQVVDDPEVVLTTVLGSCVAACLRDPEARVGGMNHFLLPGDMESFRNGDAERAGVHLMELLVNGLLKRGARRERLEGKLFGGARMMEGLSDIGAKNAAFAKRFLINEGIKIVAEALGGTRGRRIEYFPVTGQARQIFLSGGDDARILSERVVKPSSAGSVELF